MRKNKDVLRLKHEADIFNRAFGRSCLISKETVKAYLRKAEEAGLGWPLPERLSENALGDKLFPWAPDLGGRREKPVCAEVQEELRKKGVTRQFLWLEYTEGQASSVRYSPTPWLISSRIISKIPSCCPWILTVDHF